MPAPPPDPETPHPLPRRPAPRPAQPSRTVSRPRFQGIDALWTLLLCLISVAFSASMGEITGRRLGGSVAAAGIAGVLYLLGWRARDRAAGVSAGLLAALSPQFLYLAAYSQQSAPFALLSLAALFAFVAGSSLAALALAAAAAMVRPDGLLLGLLLLGLSVAQRRKRSGYGALIFLVPLAGFEIGRSLLGFGHIRLPVFGLQAGVWHWLWEPATVLLVWLLLPFCAELSEPQRLARWLPIVLWMGISLLTASTAAVTNPTGMLLPVMALLYALAGGGLSRLLPTLAGEFPSPALRYALATAAVLTLIGLHRRLEPRLPTHPVFSVSRPTPGQ